MRRTRNAGGAQVIDRPTRAEPRVRVPEEVVEYCRRHHLTRSLRAVLRMLDGLVSVGDIREYKVEKVTYADASDTKIVFDMTTGPDLEAAFDLERQCWKALRKVPGNSIIDHFLLCADPRP